MSMARASSVLEVTFQFAQKLLGVLVLTFTCIMHRPKITYYPHEDGRSFLSLLHPEADSSNETTELLTHYPHSLEAQAFRIRDAGFECGFADMFPFDIICCLPLWSQFEANEPQQSVLVQILKNLQCARWQQWKHPQHERSSRRLVFKVAAISVFTNLFSNAARAEHRNIVCQARCTRICMVLWTILGLHAKFSKCGPTCTPERFYMAMLTPSNFDNHQLFCHWSFSYIDCSWALHIHHT